MTGKTGKKRLNPLDKYQIVDKETRKVEEVFRIKTSAMSYIKEFELAERCELIVKGELK